MNRIYNIAGDKDNPKYGKNFSDSEIQPEIIFPLFADKNSDYNSIYELKGYKT